MSGLDGLIDKPRSGRTPALNEHDHKRLQALLAEHSHQIRALQARFQEETGKSIATVALRQALKKNGYSFKRIRHSLKPQRDETDFRNTQGLMKALHEREDQGEHDLYYFYESGFSQASSVPYAWSPIGKPWEVTAYSRSRKLNVLEFLSRAGKLVYHTTTETVTTETVIEAFDQFVIQKDPDTLAVVVLDNASMHRSKAFRCKRVEWMSQRVGGHTFGKMHGNGPADAVGKAPEEAKLHEMGVGWANKHETGLGEYTITSGLEGAWTPTPTKWDNTYLETIFSHEWQVKKSPAGANQWEPVEVKDGFWVPDAHVEGRMNPPVMNAADMAMIVDPDYLKISKEYRENPDVLADEFARAWYKLLHRDMGPRARYLGPQVPDEVLVWQDPTPEHEGPLVTDEQIATLKQAIADTGLTAKQLVETAWASACTYRQTGHRGGANGARIRLEPQTGWGINVRGGVADVIDQLERIKGASEANISLADMIVLGGSVGVEMAAKAAGHELTVPFTPGRTDATQEMTEVDAHAYLEPRHDAFRNYMQAQSTPIPAEHLMIDRAFMLNLSAPQMAALLGGMRAIGINAGDHNTDGIFTHRPGQLTNDFFVNLIDMGTVWEPVDENEERFVGRDRKSGETKWTATRVDLVYGSNSQLRAIAEEYAANGGERHMLHKFISGWVKVMENDRFDLHR